MTLWLDEAGCHLVCMILKVLCIAAASFTCLYCLMWLLPTGDDQLPDIMRYLNNVDRASVTNLGLVLGLQYNTMKNLSSDTFLNDVVTRWLGRTENVLSKGTPSWRCLVKGLRDKLVKQNGIANEIAEEYRTQGMCCFTLVYKCISIFILAILFLLYVCLMLLIVWCHCIR